MKEKNESPQSYEKGSLGSPGEDKKESWYKRKSLWGKFAKIWGA